MGITKKIIGPWDPSAFGEVKLLQDIMKLTVLMYNMHILPQDTCFCEIIWLYDTQGTYYYENKKNGLSNW